MLSVHKAINVHEVILLSDQPSAEDNEQSSITNENKKTSSKSSSSFSKKLMDWVNAKFSNVFSESHWIFTVIFFACAVFLAILRFFSGSLNFALYVATILIFTFLFMFVFSSINKIAPFILEGKLLRRVIMFLIFFGISLVLVIILFVESDQAPAKYHYENMLPIIYILVFFGWNAIQIYFIVKGMDGIAVKAEAAIFVKGIPKEQKLSRGMIWLIVCIAIPPGIQAVILALLFTNNQGITAMINDATGQIIFGVWFGAIIVLLVAASLNVYRLYKQTVKHDTPSVLLSFLHMLFLVYTLYRSYQFINSAGKVIQGIGQGLAPADEVIDLILIVLALLLLFQGLGSKLGKLSLFTKKNVPFFAYLVATAFIMGQVAILISLTSVPPAFVSMLNNLMMMSVAMIYYFVYLKRKLMDEDYLERDTFSAYEIQGMFNEYTSVLLSTNNTLDAAKVNDQLKQFLISKEIAITREPTSAPPAIPSLAPKPVEEIPEKQPVVSKKAKAKETEADEEAAPSKPVQEEEDADQPKQDEADSPKDEDDEKNAGNDQDE